MTHHHHHDHSHHHHAEDHTESTMSFEEKLGKILAHWIKHNSDHAQTYENWAEKAKENGLEEIAQLLEQVSQMTLDINTKFHQAVEKLPKQSS